MTITLNGREVSGHSGMTILELAQESGIDIPTLCHDPHLIPIGACRICLVEDERSGSLLASCVTPISPGMLINTASSLVMERRKVIIKLILASHVDACLVCDKGNRCELRQIAADMGIGLVELQRMLQPATIEEINPFIERDLSKCILCAKCIRADQELVVVGAIDYIHRGIMSKPATLNDMPLEKSECTFCGTCVAFCPTGALTEKASSYQGTTSTITSTICSLCGCGCSVCLEVKDNHIVRVRSGKEGVNHGALCVKGSYGYDFVHSPERLTKPLTMVNGSFEEIPWEHALNLIAAELNQIKETHGSSSLAVLGSSKCTNEENYLLQRFARGVLGTNNIDNGSRVYGSAIRADLGWALGSPIPTNSLDELESSDVILVIGANPTSSAPIIEYAIKRAVRYKGAKLLLVDPQQIKLSSFANIWLKPKIGTDIALINGLTKMIIDEGLLDEEFVIKKINNFEVLNKSLELCTLEYVEDTSGVSGQEVRLAARLFADANQASIIYGNGITQHITGTDSVMALANLAMLTGKTRHRRTGIYALQRDCNGQGACDMGALPNYLPGYQSIENAQTRKNFTDKWGIELPVDTGLTALEMIEQAKERRIKGMYIVGENPALSFPHLNLVRDTLASLDFLIVQDLFLTETAKHANVILPTVSFAEKDGTLTNFEGKVQQLRQVITPLGESLPDWEIILRLANKMGCPMPYSSLHEVIDEIKEMVPSYKTELGGSSLDNRSSYNFQSPNGFNSFSPVQYILQSEKTEDEYPLTLLTGSILYQFGAGSRSSRASRLKKFQSDSFIEVSQVDAQRLGINQDDKVKVISPMGEVITKARPINRIPEGILFMPISFPDSPVNKLFSIALDPKAKTPSCKACTVKLEKD